MPYTPLDNPVIGDNGKRTVQLVGDFVLTQLARHRQVWKAKGEIAPPLIVGVQGPQGCGKSHLTSLLPAYLEAPPHSLRLGSLSLDDIYSDHKTLSALAATNPTNGLIQGRGQPGTHDLPLGESCLKAFSSSNLNPSKPIKLPVYDKSRFGGQGDRSEEVVTVQGPLDVVIFEGWMLGFGPLADTELSWRCAEVAKDPKAYGDTHLDYSPPFFAQHDELSLTFINKELRKYVAGLWSYLDCMVQLKPVQMNYIWEWRLQQEHAMKAKNGGKGMTDDEVKGFIGRYMPGYELFMDEMNGKSTRWSGNSLQLVVGRSREILGTLPF
ncbi:P-loop containing nucleoside triphosphate hydrolase protein [Meredithblackwellia eburnea MCA 4105]